MRLARLRRVRWAAWVGLLALAFNALLPIHIAFDLAEAADAGYPHGARYHVHGVEWTALARLSGHDGGNGKSGEHGNAHPAACAVCSALGALAAFAPAAAVALLLPPAAALPAAFAAIGGQPAGLPLAYRSRAPPGV